jgi:glycosyltransferase involved in cell wall biosynthesis
MRSEASTQAVRSEAASPTGNTRATLVHITTVPISLAIHLSGQLEYIRRRGFVIHVITSPGAELDTFAARERVPVHAIPMARAITPAKDLVALWKLWRTLRRIRPDIVHSHTPKGGLLGMMAAALARTPVRVYHIRGLPFVTATGFRRWLLRLSELTSCSLAHRVLAVSHSMQAMAVEEGLCPAQKVKVILGGSGNGVDSDGRFRPPDEDARKAARARLQFPANAIVVGFVGRVSREKGIRELAEAWQRLRELEPRARLLLVGWIEANDAESSEAVKSLRADPRVNFTGPVPDTVPFYAAMDVVALPTYREGFPNAALEAAAMALPIVATSVPGCVDAVQDGVTGILVPAQDAEGLERALRNYLSDPALRVKHGEAGRRRVATEFRREAIWDGILLEYIDLLSGSTDAAPPSAATSASGS